MRFFDESDIVGKELLGGVFMHIVKDETPMNLRFANINEDNTGVPSGN